MNQSRITVVEQVYFQQHAQQPLTFDSKFSANLDSDEQPYIRQTTIGAEWVPLDYGWLPECGLLVLTNDGDEDKIVELSFGSNVPHITISPKHSIRIFPTSVKNISLLCRTGQCRIVINLFPR